MAKTRTRSKKEKEGHEIYDNPEVLAEQLTKTEQFFEENKTASLIIIGVIALVLAGFFGYRYYITNQNNLAQADMFQAVYYFEQDSLNLALRGDGNNYGFLDIVDEYPGTEASNLAHFYAGVSYLRTGNFNGAITYLEDFSSDDLMVQARAYSLIGDAYMEQGDYQSAVSNYEKAYKFKSNEYFSPTYMIKAALAYEKLEQYDEAMNIYSTIVTEYKESPEFQNAQKALSRLENMES